MTSRAVIGNYALSGLHPPFIHQYEANIAEESADSMRPRQDTPNSPANPARHSLSRILNSWSVLIVHAKRHALHFRLTTLVSCRSRALLPPLASNNQPSFTSC